MSGVKKTFKNLLDLEEPVLTKALAPKLAPFAKIVYIVGLILMILRLIKSVLYFADFPVFLFELLMVIVEFAILRMFCEYLTSTSEKKK